MTRGVFAGLATLDVVHRVHCSPAPNQKVTAVSQSVSVGGPAANAALTFAALGGEATLLTALGRSPVAGLIRSVLEEFGVRVLDVTPDADHEPPVSAGAVQISSGERSVVSLDAVNTVVPIPPDLAGLIRAADVLLADGHYPVIGIEAAKIAFQQGILVVVDAGRWKPAMPRLIATASDLVCSNDFRTPGHPDQDDTISQLASSGPARVVVTRGPGPVSWRESGSAGEVAVPAIPVVDTLGAGDAFHGAYAYYASSRTTRHLELPARVALSIGVATARCAADGPRAWLALLRDWSATAPAAPA